MYLQLYVMSYVSDTNFKPSSSMLHKYDNEKTAQSDKEFYSETLQLYISSGISQKVS